MFELLGARQSTIANPDDFNQIPAASANSYPNESMNLNESGNNSNIFALNRSEIIDIDNDGGGPVRQGQEVDNEYVDNLAIKRK